MNVALNIYCLIFFLFTYTPQKFFLTKVILTMKSKKEEIEDDDNKLFEEEEGASNDAKTLIDYGLPPNNDFFSEKTTL